MWPRPKHNPPFSHGLQTPHLTQHQGEVIWLSLQLGGVRLQCLVPVVQLLMPALLHLHVCAVVLACIFQQTWWWTVWYELFCVQFGTILFILANKASPGNFDIYFYYFKWILVKMMINVQNNELKLSKLTEQLHKSLLNYLFPPKETELKFINNLGRRWCNLKMYIILRYNKLHHHHHYHLPAAASFCPSLLLMEMRCSRTSDVGPLWNSSSL